MLNVDKTLHQQGYRLTKQRRQILGALTPRPQSVNEMMHTLKPNGIDKVTVYRALDCFVQLGIAGKIQLDDNTAHYELLAGSRHHHHLICKSCGSVEDIPLNEKLFLNKIRKLTKFQIQRHALEFFGLCAKCQ